jgi:hypothetical protein
MQPRPSQRKDIHDHHDGKNNHTYGRFPKGGVTKDRSCVLLGNILVDFKSSAVYRLIYGLCLPSLLLVGFEFSVFGHRLFLGAPRLADRLP